MELKQFFAENKKPAIAFSGGVDSAYLLSEAKKYGADAKAYFVKTPFQPQFELADAQKTAETLSAELTVLELNTLGCAEIAENPQDRCYYCKRQIFGEIAKAAQKDGCSVILDGTNASDDADDRPGMRATAELGVRSPLRECGITKQQIRRGAREAGLDVWDKPAYACLATRIPCGEIITAEKLKKTEAAENDLRSLGFTDLRVRMIGDGAKLQLPAEQIERANKMKKEIYAELSKYYAWIREEIEER